MRSMYILRGAPGCGKSTWIENNNLTPYTVSSDEVRLSLMSPELNAQGKLQIPQRNQDVVWKTVRELITERMKNGDLVILDSTALKTKDMMSWKKLASTYRYRVYVVDFTDVPREVAHKRNQGREELRQVPGYVIDQFYDMMNKQKVPNGYTVVTPDEAISNMFVPHTYDAQDNGYKAVNIIGDIQGCYTALSNMMEDNLDVSDMVLKDDELYVFTGDYCERGIENAEVLSVIMEWSKQPNTIFIEGNHEKWLYKWSHNDPIESEEFRSHTKGQLHKAQIDKKEVSRFYHRLYQLSYITIGGNKILITHGGLSNLHIPFAAVSSYELLHGNGKRDAAQECDYYWSMNTQKAEKDFAHHLYSVHGHRFAGPVHNTEFTYSLEDNVEYGGTLRCVRFDDKGNIETYETVNTVFSIPTDSLIIDNNTDIEDIIGYLRDNKEIREKKLGNVSSFNFSRHAFEKGIWNQQTVRARGLFINTKDNYITARSYDKFFNIGEKSSTTLEALKDTLAFPVDIYLKENGYLGIISYDKDNDDLFTASKSTTEGDFADWLREAIDKEMTASQKEYLKNYLKEHNQTAIVEVVDQEHDAHIIEYDKSGLYLLALVDNAIDFSEASYDTVKELADKIGIEPKEYVTTLHNFDEFVEWYDEVIDPDYQYNGRFIEGFVITDANGFMVKIKGDYYKYWKAIRGMSNHIWSKGSSSAVERIATQMNHPEVRNLYKWMKEYLTQEKDKGILQVPHVIEIRKAWEKYNQDNE